MLSTKAPFWSEYWLFLSTIVKTKKCILIIERSIPNREKVNMPKHSNRIGLLTGLYGQLRILSRCVVFYSKYRYMFNILSYNMSWQTSLAWGFIRGRLKTLFIKQDHLNLTNKLQYVKWEVQDYNSSTDVLEWYHVYIFGHEHRPIQHTQVRPYIGRYCVVGLVLVILHGRVACLYLTF